MKKKQGHKASEFSPASITMAAVLLTSVALMGDSLSANSHVALYGAMPSVQTSAASSRTAVKRKKAATLRPAASSSSRPSSLKNPAASPFPSDDGTGCTKANPKGCYDMINALGTTGDPACILSDACKDTLRKVINTADCVHGLSCKKAASLYLWYVYSSLQCARKENPQCPAALKKELEKAKTLRETID